MKRADRAALLLRCWPLPAPRRRCRRFDEVRAAHRPSDITLLDRHGAPLQTLRIDKPRAPPAVGAAGRHVAGAAAGHRAQRRPALLRAQRRRLARPSAQQRLGQRVEHAHARRVDADDAARRPARRRPGAARRRPQRGAEARPGRRRPTQLERAGRRAQILEAYLNRVPFRGELVGIDALAQTLFGKHPSGLDAQEAAIAAALVRAPNAHAAAVARARLRRAAAAAAGLRRRGRAGASARCARRGGMPLGEQLAPHFARQALACRDGAGAAAQHARRRPAARGRRGAAPAAGRAARPQRRGRRGARARQRQRRGAGLGRLQRRLSDAAQVDGVLARRQPGSTLKPFVYALAFEQRLITPASLLDDSPAQIATAAGLYLPQNYDRDFKGWVSARTALGASLNVPAVRVGAMLGADALFAAAATRFGLALPRERRLLRRVAGARQRRRHAARADQRLPRAGQRRRCWRRRRCAPRGDARRARARVADAAAVHLVTDILADNNARAPHLRPRQRAGHARLRRGEDRHQQGHARQLVHRLHRPLHGRRVGRQRQRRADARRQRRQRRGAGLARAGAAAARRPAVAARRRRRRASSRARRLRREREPPRDEVFIAGTEQRAAARGAAAPAPPSASPARATAASSRSTPTCRRRAQRIIFEGERRHLGARRPARWARRRGCAGRRGRAGTSWRCAAPSGALQTREVRFEVRGAAAAARQASR